MNKKYKNQLRSEINKVFKKGINKLNVELMVENFIDKNFTF